MPLTNAQYQKAWRDRQRAAKLKRGVPCARCGKYEDEVEVMVFNEDWACRTHGLCGGCVDFAAERLAQYRRTHANTLATQLAQYKRAHGL